MCTDASSEKPPPCCHPSISDKRICLQQPPTHEGFEHPAAHPLLHLLDGRFAQLRGPVKAHAPGLCLIQPVDHAGVEVVMRVKRCPEAVWEDHCPGARLGTGVGALAAQLPLHFLESGG